MKRRNITRVRPAAPVKGEAPQKIRMLAISVVCVAVVAAGFFFAARQHFATMEFGLKNSQLRKQVENLEAERRRLILAKEMSLSPASIKQTASKLGFKEQLAAPPSTVETRADRASVPAAPAAELASIKTVRSLSVPAAKAIDEKQLVKPIVQQATIKSQSPNERPRIAVSEAVAASLTKAPKLR